MIVLIVIIIFLFLLGFLSTGKGIVATICNVLLVLFVLWFFIEAIFWSEHSFWYQLISFFLLLIPIGFGMHCGEKIDKETKSSSDIPDYYNWDRIYDSLKGQEISESRPMTLERAIEHFRMDYAHIRNAFSNEEKLQGYEVDDYKKDILEMFDRFEDSLATNQVSLSDYGNLRFRISCKTSNGSVQYYDHFPVRQYSKYDMRMWKGYLYIHDEYWVSYGLSNEHRQQYWRAFDGHYRFGMDASRGKAEETAIR